MGEESRNKRREHLKWEYLKRSEDYRELCECQKKRTPGIALPEKFQPENGPIFKINPMIHTYLKYKDIHSMSFEDWYSSYYKEGEGTLLGSVDDLSGADPSMRYFMRNTFIYIIDRCKRGLGREPSSFLEMADFLCAQMRMESGFQSYLKIKQGDFTSDEARRLADEVYKILMKRVPRERLRDKELETYLIVYDMRKEGRTDDEIKNRIYKVDDLGNVEGKRIKDNKGEKEVIDEINKYCRYAERLIKNAERDIYSDENIFPGEYWKKKINPA